VDKEIFIISANHFMYLSAPN